MNCLVLLILLCCCGNNDGMSSNMDCKRKHCEPCRPCNPCEPHRPCGRNEKEHKGKADCMDMDRGNKGNTWGCSNDVPDKKLCEDERGSRPEQFFDGRQMNEFYGDDSRRDRGYSPYTQGTTCGCEE